MKGFLRTCLYQTMRKRIDESKLNIRIIEIPEAEVSCFNLSSNRILSFSVEGEQFYFRECPPLLCPRDFFNRETALFFKMLPKLHINETHFKQEVPIVVSFSQETVSTFQKYICRLEENDAIINNLSNADVISQNLNFSIWEPREYDQSFFEAFGLVDVPDDCVQIAVYFLWCMRGASQTHRTLHITCGERHSYFFAVKSMASSLVAESLGLGRLVTTAELCRLVFENGDSLLGIISNAAPGSRMVDSDVLPCGSLQRELMSLSVLDLICMQTDHGPNNYNVAQMNGEYRVCAFDNDNPNTFLPLPVLRRGLAGCSRLVDGNGLLNRPYVSRTLYSSICDLDLVELNRAVKPYLNCLQRAALLVRIKGLRKVLRKASRERSGFILEDGQWNAQTAAQELSGNYGNTYLTIAVKEEGKHK